MDILKIRERIREKAETGKSAVDATPVEQEVLPVPTPETAAVKPRPAKKRKKARAKTAPVPAQPAVEESAESFETEFQVPFQADADSSARLHEIPKGAIPPEEMELSQDDIHGLYGTQEMPELPEMDIALDLSHEMLLEKPAEKPETAAPRKREDKPDTRRAGSVKRRPEKTSEKPAPEDAQKTAQEEEIAEIEKAAEVQSKEAAATPIEFLSFMLGREEYALPLARISEIIKPHAITETPRCPPFVLGILSLRGVIIPVFDLAGRLGLGKVKHSKLARIVIVRRSDGESVGLAVDRVQDVVRVLQRDIEPPPPAMVGAEAQFLEGVGRAEDSRRMRSERQEDFKNVAAEAKQKTARRKLVILLNLDKVATL